MHQTNIMAFKTALVRQEFLVCETLGRGSSGIVHRVKRLRDGHIFAMKAGQRNKKPEKQRPDPKKTATQ